MSLVHYVPNPPAAASRRATLLPFGKDRIIFLGEEVNDGQPAWL